MRLKTHIQNQQQQQLQQSLLNQSSQNGNSSGGGGSGIDTADSRLRSVAAENEKNQLILEIYKLRDLLSDIKNLNTFCAVGGATSDEADWRSAMLKAISDIFLNQKEHLLAELRSFISNNGFAQQKDYVAYLENKIDTLVCTLLSFLETTEFDLY